MKERREKSRLIKICQGVRKFFTVILKVETSNGKFGLELIFKKSSLTTNIA